MTKSIPFVQLKEGFSPASSGLCSEILQSKENLLLDFSTILEVTGFIKNKEGKMCPNVH